jgi:hypothetical protein
MSSGKRRIFIAFIFIAFIFIAFIFICWRKRCPQHNMKQIMLHLDSRFGAKSITSPNSGAYGNPYTSPIKAAEPFEPGSLSIKERQVVGTERAAITRQAFISRSQRSFANGWQDTHSHKGDQLPPYSGPALPTLQAYRPEPGAESPVTSIDSENSIQLSTYSSPRSSSKTKISPLPPISVPLS